MKYYKTASWQNGIGVVEVERETETSVFIGGRRRAKNAGCENYFSSWEKARDYLIEKAATRLNNAARSLEEANSDYKEKLLLPLSEPQS